MKIEITPPPRCYSCGAPLSHVYKLYAAEYRNRVDEFMKEKGLLLGDMASTMDTNILMGDVLTSLGIRRICCRTRVISHSA
jgi:DNA-directed RNA polymerase subunit N (RpoN/RPB10)